MRKINELYLKTQRLIAETHRDTEEHTVTHRETHTETYSDPESHKDKTHRYRNTHT